MFRLPSFVSSLPSRFIRPNVYRFVCSANDPPLESLTNSRVKYARALQRRKHREKDRRVVLEGHRLVLDAVDAGYRFDELFYTEKATNRTPSLTPAFDACFKRATLVSEKVMNWISGTITPQGVLGVISRPSFTIPKSSNLLLLLDQISDPGNIGTLVRTAAATGTDAVLLSPGCADVWGGKALRAGMGAQLRIPTITNVTWNEIDRLKMRVCVADGAKKSVEYSKVDWSIPSIIVLGSEANGPSIEAKRRADEIVRIPMYNQVESLNAAIAGAVILFETKRQLREKVAAG